MTRKSPLSRRAVLRGAGGVALALPFLEAMRGPTALAAPASSPRRLVTWLRPGGAVRDKWLPADPASFALGPTLEPLAPFRGQLLQVDGLDYKVAERSAGHPHYAGLAAYLTGTPLPRGNLGVPDGAGGDPTGWAQGPSVDQVVAEAIGGASKLRSLDIMVRHDGPRGANPATNSLYEGANKPRTPMFDPLEVWDRLFKDLPGPDAPSASTRPGKSVLDFVAEEYRVLAQTLGGADRARVEEHLTEIRAVERALGEVIAPAVTCAPGARPTATAFSSANYGKLGQIFCDITALALACDLTRVVNLQWGDPRTRYSMPWVGLGQNHHFYQHDGSYRPAELFLVERWYAEQFAYLLGKLAAVKEGDRTLLDSVLVYSASEISHAGTHSLSNIPILLAGSLGGAFRTGRFLRYPGRSHVDLLLAVLAGFGIEAKSFGWPGYATGVLTGLT